MLSAGVRNLIFHVNRQQYFKNFCASYSTSLAYQEEKIKIGKYNINYLKTGHGPHSVLCMPGAMGSIWTDFKPQLERFDREKFTLVVWDAPGYGKSRPPEREFVGDYYAIDVDIAFEFMKALNMPKFSILGWSYGGASSMTLAATYPAAVRKLVVWGTSSFVLPHEIELYKNIKDVRTWSEKMRKPMIELYGEDRFAKLWAEVVDAMVVLYNNTNGRDRICHYLKNLMCPTLILHGEKDPLVDKSHVSHLRRYIRGSRVHLYPEGKHNIHIQYAEDFNKRVQEFLLES